MMLHQADIICDQRNKLKLTLYRSETTERPHHAKHALRVTGRMDFFPHFVITSPAIMEGLYATVPVQITMGMLLGKVSLSQLSTVQIHSCA